MWPTLSLLLYLILPSKLDRQENSNLINLAKKAAPDIKDLLDFFLLISYFH